MDGLTLSLVCFAGMLFLIAIRTPIGVALGVVSFLGFWELKNFNVAIGQMREAYGGRDATSKRCPTTSRRTGIFRRSPCSC